VLASCLLKAPTASEHLRVIEQIKDVNRFMKMMWEKELGISDGDPMTAADMCDNCMQY
jgi:hypothetical protein